MIFPQELAQASHPIQKALAEGDTSQRVLLLFIAAVAAPIVEEIIFRGVLFVHLRDLSRRWGRFLSFLFLRNGIKSDLRSDPSAGDHFYSNSGCARSCILSCARDAWKFDLVHGRTRNQ